MYMNIDWNTLRDRAYECAKAHGWHEKEHDVKHYLMLIITEIAEVVNADRKNRYADAAKFEEWQGNNVPLSEETRTRRFNEDFEAYIKDTVEDELADIVIRCLDLAGLYKADLAELDKVFKAKNISEAFNVQYDNFISTAYQLCAIATLKENLSIIIIGIIYGTCMLAKKLNIDIIWHIEQKMKYNETREYKHGKRY